MGRRDWSRGGRVTGAGKALERDVLSYGEWVAVHERPHLKQNRAHPGCEECSVAVGIVRSDQAPLEPFSDLVAYRGQHLDLDQVLRSPSRTLHPDEVVDGRHEDGDPVDVERLGSLHQFVEALHTRRRAEDVEVSRLVRNVKWSPAASVCARGGTGPLRRRRGASPRAPRAPPRAVPGSPACARNRCPYRASPSGNRADARRSRSRRAHAVTVERPERQLRIEGIVRHRRVALARSDRDCDRPGRRAGDARRATGRAILSIWVRSIPAPGRGMLVSVTPQAASSRSRVSTRGTTV